MMTEKKIGLCAILRNESKVVERMLRSCSSIVSSIAITDTGSTDNTKEIIERIAQEKNIPCAINEDTWINFGVSRTHSILYARREFPRIDYWLLLDGDMVLSIDSDFSSAELNVGEYLLTQQNGDLSYRNTRLVSGKKLYRSVGCTHEYWGCPISSVRANFDKLTIKDMNDGGSRSNKISRDKKWLLQASRKSCTPDYLLARYSFYLAQTYQGEGNHELSNSWYERRIKLGGWDQETFYSQYKIAQNHYRDENNEEAVLAYLKAYDSRPTRAETILGLVKTFKRMGLTECAKLFGEIGSSMPKSNDSLFILDHAYDKDNYLQEIISL